MAPAAPERQPVCGGLSAFALETEERCVEITGAQGSVCAAMAKSNPGIATATPRIHARYMAGVNAQ